MLAFARFQNFSLFRFNQTETNCFDIAAKETTETKILFRTVPKLLRFQLHLFRIETYDKASHFNDLVYENKIQTSVKTVQ
jgi:hypothetical protein